MPHILFALALLIAGGAQAQPAPRAADRILGEWRGESICTHRELAPACHDEVIHYVFTARGDGLYHQAAYKLVDGVEDLMGEADLAYDAAAARWTFTFDARTCPHCVWWYSINAAGQLSGGITSQSGMELRRVSASRR
jgi:hypothetical protein